MWGFKKKVKPVAEQSDTDERFRAWISFIDDTCKGHLIGILDFKHPDWEKLEKSADFKNLRVMYTAAYAGYEQHADYIFLQWIRVAEGVGINANKTTEFYYMVNRRFSHLAQIRCYLDYKLKLTLISADERMKLLPELNKILSPEMSNAFFPTPAATQQEPLASPVTTSDKPSGKISAEDSVSASAANIDNSLRGEVGRLYERGVNPLHAIKAMFYDTDGNPTTDAKRLTDIWLGINDLLERDGIKNTLRSQIVSVRDVMATVIEDCGPGPKSFITNYRKNTRRINEMKFLQSYKLLDVAEIIQLEALNSMLAEIEHERANNPGSRAQDLSDQTFAKLYSLRDNWDDPSKLK